MDKLLLGAVELNDMWYALPLVVAISLVYSATRHEQMGPVLAHAIRIGIWIFVFMAVVFALLWLVDRRL